MKILPGYEQKNLHTDVICWKKYQEPGYKGGNPDFLFEYRVGGHVDWDYVHDEINISCHYISFHISFY